MTNRQSSEQSPGKSVGGLALMCQTAARVFSYVAARWIWERLS